MKNFNLLLIIFIMFFSVNTAKAEMDAPAQRVIQTRYYETTDVNQVFKAAINTLQDSGFIITNIEPEVGFIRAKMDSKIRRTNHKLVALRSTDIFLQSALLAISAYGGYVNVQSAMNIHNDARWIKNELQNKTVIEDLNVVVSLYNEKVRVRITIQEKTLENADGYCYVVTVPRSVVWILKEKIFENIFSQMNKSLYIEGQKLSI